VNRRAFAIVGPAVFSGGAKCIGSLEQHACRRPRRLGIGALERRSPGAETDTVLEFFVARE
jgi:hypothetical protein